LMMRRWRCFDGGPKVSTMIRFAVSSRSIALARAAAVQFPAPGCAWSISHLFTPP
jgi:hypothetical protein